MTAHDPRVTLTEAEREALRDLHGIVYADAQREGCPPAEANTEACEAVWLPVEELIAARLAPIRALADKWSTPESHRAGAYVRERDAADLIRAALEATGADLSASQDHDGAEGQGEGEKAGEARSMFSTCCYYVGTPSCRCPNPTPDFSDIARRRS